MLIWKCYCGKKFELGPYENVLEFNERIFDTHINIHILNNEKPPKKIRKENIKHNWKFIKKYIKEG